MGTLLIQEADRMPWPCSWRKQKHTWTATGFKCEVIDCNVTLVTAASYASKSQLHTAKNKSEPSDTKTHEHKVIKQTIHRVHGTAVWTDRLCSYPVWRSHRQLKLIAFPYVPLATSDECHSGVGCRTDGLHLQIVDVCAVHVIPECCWAVGPWRRVKSWRQHHCVVSSSSWERCLNVHVVTKCAVQGVVHSWTCVRRRRAASVPSPIKIIQALDLSEAISSIFKVDRQASWQWDERGTCIETVISLCFSS